MNQDNLDYIQSLIKQNKKKNNPPKKIMHKKSHSNVVDKPVEKKKTFFEETNIETSKHSNQKLKCGGSEKQFDQFFKSNKNVKNTNFNSLNEDRLNTNNSEENKRRPLFKLNKKSIQKI